ncbi:MAG TPA: GNAT family N-acetyltransferase [Terracidiphilus sp.]|nr:GNAT family N-acetyltransferase [Terracidiphilus sp.]
MTPPELAIRPLVVADIDAAMALSAALAHAPHWSRTIWRAVVDSESVPARLVLGAFVSGQLCGLAVASLTPPEAELESIAVAAASQRQGIASELFYAISARLREAGIDSVLLEVRVSNGPARALYATLGFVEAGHRPGYYADPQEDAIVLRHGLN